MIHILVVDDHTLVREGLCRLLDSERDIEVVGQCGTGREAVALAKTLNPDVVLLDYKLPDMDGLETTEQIIALETKAKILIKILITNRQSIIIAKIRF